SGPESAKEFEKYFYDTRDLFSCFDIPVMQNPNPSMLDMNRAVLNNPKILFKMHPLRTLSGLLNYKFRDKRLQQLFGRYATYVGGSPLESPALLSLIWQAEARGVWSVKGGMKKLARVLEKLAADRGASFHYNTEVKNLNFKHDRLVSVTDNLNISHEADKFIFNGDPRALALGRLGQKVKKAASKEADCERSLSAYVWGFDAKVSGPDLVHHNVFFSDVTNSEFYDIKKGKMPVDPSIYICAQDRGKNAPYPTTERFEIILNAPPVSKRKSTPEDYEKCKEITFKRLEMFGLTFQSKLKRENLTTPQDFEGLFPASDGSLYGRSPHSLLATLKRPKCATSLQNLFLVGGGVHPGAGVPMATLCAQLAVEEMTKDQTSISTFPQMATHGGTLTESTR
ncbi:MAG: FAD-dependent oxidoreductase, partial [Pseudomonadota bacterium]|nr:FAD-dependent oxidoreductase [Pseudomonadota bacterium]